MYKNPKSTASLNYEGFEQSPNAFDEIMDFNTKYARYIQCNDTTINPGNVLKCTDDQSSMAGVNAAYEKLVGSTSNLQKSLEAPTKSKVDYLSTHNSILNNHQDLLKLRADLDLKMKELYDIRNRSKTDNQMKYDSTMYSGILWTVIASSLVYYGFTKL
jgi:hypothetical protein